MTKEQHTLYEMLQNKNIIISDESQFSEIDKLLKWNDDIEKTEEVISGHSIRVAYLAKELAEKINLPKEEVTNIYFAALFHDIGKHFIPKEILGKKDKLTEDEFEIMKKHCNLAEDILRGILSEDIIKIIKAHHERLDGSGYPQGISIEDKGARILGIVDSYDAMTTARVYTHAKTENEALRELELCTSNIQGKGLLYDPSLVHAFKDIILLEHN